MSLIRKVIIICLLQYLEVDFFLNKTGHSHPCDNTTPSNLCKTATLKKTKMVFKTDYRLMQVKSIAECSNGSILQYFRPSLSYQLSLRPLFCLFLSGRFTQVLLYCQFDCRMTKIKPMSISFTAKSSPFSFVA